MPVGIGNKLSTFETNHQALISVECPGILPTCQIEGERKAFYGVCKKLRSLL